MTTWLERFTQALAVLCGGKQPPAEAIRDWDDPGMDSHALQSWAISNAWMEWAQGVAIIDAARLLADQPAEGEGHEESPHPAGAGVALPAQPSDEQVTAALRAACLYDTSESRKDMRKALMAAAGVTVAPSHICPECSTGYAKQQECDWCPKVQTVDAPCLTCAANHHCPTHNPAPAGVAPSQAPSLYQQIMNLPDGIQPNAPDDTFMRGFRFGHRAARHAAAELVASRAAQEGQRG